MGNIPVCCITGRVVGDGDACGDCDPCIMGASHVPDPVRRLIKERDEWREKYVDAAMELDFFKGVGCDLEYGDIRPCPFCGGEAARVDCEDVGDDNFGGSFICCTRCNAASNVVFGYKETLYSSWNERSSSANQPRGLSAGEAPSAETVNSNSQAIASDDEGGV